MRRFSPNGSKPVSARDRSDRQAAVAVYSNWNEQGVCRADGPLVWWDSCSLIFVFVRLCDPDEMRGTDMDPLVSRVRRLAHGKRAGHMIRTTRWTAVVLWLVGGACLIQAHQALVAPPPGASLLLELSGDGVQIYTCEEKNHHVEWTFKAPEGKAVRHAWACCRCHSAGPTWRAEDGSAVVGEVITAANAPEATAIPWLLLRVKSHEGAGMLATAAYIRRVDTKGGVAPSTGCDASHVSEQTRVPYPRRISSLARHDDARL